MRAALTAFTLALLLAPAAAQAQCQGAPGVGAVAEYCEQVPSGSGGSTQPGDRATNAAPLSDRTAAKLAAAGADGAAVARLAGAGGGDKAGGTGGKGGTAGSAAGSGSKSAASQGVTPPADPSSSPLKAATAAVATGPTAGGTLLWVLVGLSALGAGAAVFSRRRNASH